MKKEGVLLFHQFPSKSGTSRNILTSYFLRKSTAISSRLKVCSFVTRKMALCHFRVLNVRMISLLRCFDSCKHFVHPLVSAHAANRENYDDQNGQLKTPISSRYCRRLTKDIQKRKNLILMMLFGINAADSRGLFLLIEATNLRLYHAYNVT